MDAVPIETGDAVVTRFSDRSPVRGSGPRVLVIDDDLLVAEALVFALVQRGFSARFVVPATMRHLRDAVEWTPDLALLDVDLIEGDPLDFIEFFHDSGIAIAVMGRSGERQLLRRCVNAGAVAMIESSVPLDELVRMLSRLVPHAEPVFSERPPSASNGRASSDPLAPFAILTPREQSVLSELMEGRTADAIAKDAWVAVSTVRSQIKAILQKLGVNSQLAAVALARHAGWAYVGRPSDGRRIHAEPEPYEEPVAG